MKPYTASPVLRLHPTVDADLPQMPFVLYTAYTATDSVSIGQGGYLALPDEHGITQLGFEIYPAYQGQGFGHLLLDRLVEIGFASLLLRQIHAFTWPIANASNHLLRQHGFQFISSIYDAEGSPYWQWMLTRKNYQLIHLFG
jgi:[ribosomal protein S5]-alanine N-acetyltransferase